MTRISKGPVVKGVYKELFDAFVGLVIDLNDQDETRDFLNDFLTPEERLMLSKRLVLTVMLEQGYGWDEIKSVLRVSRLLLI